MQEVSGSIPLFSTKKALYFVGSTVLFFFIPAKRSGVHRSPCRRASDTPRSQSKPLSDLTLAVFSAPPAPCQGPPAYLYTSAVFLWARVDYASRAAKNSPPGCFCPFFCDGAAAVRIRPHENSILLQTENRQRISTLAVFLWARVDYASRAAKNSPLGCFCPFFCDGAAAVRIRPHENPNFLANRKPPAYLYTGGLFMGAGGFEPPKLKSSRFTVCPHWPLGNTPRFNFQSSLTACIFYHLKWHLSTTFSTDFLFFCRSLFSCVLPQ